MIKANGFQTLYFAAFLLILSACITTGPVVRVTNLQDLGQKYLDELEEIKKSRADKKVDDSLNEVIEKTPNFSVVEYLKLHPSSINREKGDYKVGGYDVLSITVYEEPDLSREKVRVAADGYISFPFIGRIKVDGMTTSEIEELISLQLAEGQFLFDAHVSVTVVSYLSKQFFVLGAVKGPGTFSLRARERVLDAISRAKGIDDEHGGEAMVVRTEHPNTEYERKIVIRIDLAAILKGTDQVSNILLEDKDVLYVNQPEYFNIIGQVQKPGRYPYLQKEISLVEALSMAGGFSAIASRNKTRIIRVENGVEQIIEVKVNEITSGKKAQDVKIKPEDVIVVPESFF